MKVHRSNRVERLLDALAEVIAEPPKDPFEPETIVVQSRAMATWLSMGLADRFGVWAGADFPFPRRFVHRVFDRVLDRSGSVEAFTGPGLLWAILAELPRHLDHASFGEVARFLADDPRGTSRFDLARRIAEAFDQYLVFRPDMILSWEAGGGDDWQARLWRAVSARLGGGHVAALARDLFSTLSSMPITDARVPGLPSRLCVFGISTLPPFHVDVLAALSRHLPVHLFVISPSRQYWADERVVSGMGSASAASDPIEALEDLDRVPPLLASLGTVGRDFQHVIEDRVHYHEDDRDLHVEPDTSSMLGRLQAGLLDFTPVASTSIADEDESVTVHACHSPMREVEALHDQLLHVLACDASLQPRDIVVMMSDVERYAPLVEAVFEREPNDPTFVPYTIADRTIRAQSPELEAFGRIVDLVGSRITASSVLDLVALEPIQRRFGISAEDVDTLTDWVRSSGIRWGIDAEHRKEHGQPKLDANTWQFGLRRLMLGYALPGRDREMFEGVLPYDEIEGQPAVLLGRFASLCGQLFELARTLEGPRGLRAWQSDLDALIDAMLDAPEGNTAGLDALRLALETLATEAELAGYEEPLPLHAVVSLLEDRIESDPPARGFMAGGVTFCAMLPMRSVPFAVVCLLGLSDGAFPRADRRVGFDLIAKHPRRGDRSRRSEDRYLFLEALLAARKRLLSFYVGQSIQDNSELPPSVVLAELVEELQRLHPNEDNGDAVRRRLVTHHPMQPFSPRYFRRDSDEGNRLFSFETGHREGAQALLGSPAEAERSPLLTEPLPEIVVPTAGLDLPLSTLLRFFRLPAAELLKRRLRVHLDDWARDHSDREPMEFTPLDEWKVGSAVLEHRLQDLGSDQSLALLRAAGVLPLGIPAEVRHETLAHVVDPIVTATRTLQVGEPLVRLDVDLRVGHTRLMGSLGERWPAGIISTQFARCSPKHLLAGWIRHLTLCVTAPRDQDLHTIIVARRNRDGASTVRFAPVADPHEHLEALVELYWQGQAEPLLLFPRSSLAFCRAFSQSRDAAAALSAASKEWNDRFTSERDDPHLRRLFGDDDPLAPNYSPFQAPLRSGDFPTLAISVFGPLLEHLEEST